MPVEYQQADKVTGKIVAVSNTGPLISAFQSGRIDLLRRYFNETTRSNRSA